MTLSTPDPSMTSVNQRAPKPKIMVVDDELINQEVMHLHLEDDYQLCCVESGISCLTMIPEFQPDMILLDVAMPHMDGYETCRALKGAAASAEIPIVFVSARGTIEERLKGFEAGGDDYIVKPFEYAELKAKMDVALKKRAEMEKLAKQVLSANLTARRQKNRHQYGELASLVQFIEHIRHCTNADMICQNLLNHCIQLGLSAIVQIRSQQQPPLTQSNEGLANPLDMDVIKHLKDKGPSFSFRQRTIFNSEQISLLIKNMPTQEKNRYQGMHDYLHIALNSCQNQLQQQTQQQSHRHQASQQIHLAQTEMETIQRLFNEQHERCYNICSDMLISLEGALIPMGLEQEQEDELLKIAEDRTEMVNNMTGNQEMLEHSFAALMRIFNQPSPDIS